MKKLTTLFGALGLVLALALMTVAHATPKPAPRGDRSSGSHAGRRAGAGTAGSSGNSRRFGCAEKCASAPA